MTLDDLWIAVLPVKPPHRAKRRLATALPDALRADLSMAMALDTVEAALACPLIGTVVVVCDHPPVRRGAGELGALAIPDTPGAGLNAALAHGAGSVGDPRAPVAALPADLPALRPAEIQAALAAAHLAGRSAFVPDAAGTGTVLLTAPSVRALAPAFGPGSANRHLAAGIQPLTDPYPGLQCDVDTPADLIRATRLGLGRRTRALLVRHGDYGG